LRADLLEPGERGGGGGAATVKARERGRLGQRELVARGDLTEPAQQQADAQTERGGDLRGVDLFDDDLISLAL